VRQIRRHQDHRRQRKCAGTLVPLSWPWWFFRRSRIAHAQASASRRSSSANTSASATISCARSETPIRGTAKIRSETATSTAMTTTPGALHGGGRPKTRPGRPARPQCRAAAGFEIRPGFPPSRRYRTQGWQAQACPRGWRTPVFEEGKQNYPAVSASTSAICLGVAEVMISCPPSVISTSSSIRMPIPRRWSGASSQSSSM